MEWGITLEILYPCAGNWRPFSYKTMHLFTFKVWITNTDVWHFQNSKRIQKSYRLLYWYSKYIPVHSACT